MTILSACQSAAVRLLGRKPAAFFGATAPFELEIADLAQEAAVDIAKAHEWQALTKITEHVGDGSTVAYSLPADYDRLLTKGNVHSADWQTTGYLPAEDLDHWINLQTYMVSGAPGYWVILDGKMQVYPPMPTGEKARYYYISKNIATGTSGEKAVIDADNDVFKLDERLLTLSLIWRWRSQKRQEYAEDLENYERALAMTAGKDRGARILKVGRPRYPAEFAFAFPGVITP